MNLSAYRIHCGHEPLETVLDPLRPDGWVCDDESVDTQPYGVSACATIQELGRYVRHYSMRVRPADVLLELDALSYSADADADEHVRVVARSYRAIATGADLAAAMEWLGENEWRLDLSGGHIDWSEEDEDGVLTSVARWLVERLVGLTCTNYPSEVAS